MKHGRFSAAAALALSLAVLSSCYPFLGSLPPGAADGPAIQHVPYTGSFSYSVDTGATPRDVYFVFTNPSKDADLAATPTFAGGSITVNGKSLPAPAPQPLPAVNSAPVTLMERVAEFNRNPWAYGAGGTVSGPQKALVSGHQAQLDAVGDVWDFKMDTNPGSTPVNATCRYASGRVDLGDGRTRALSIWVDTANWDATEADPQAMSPAKVQELADRFLKSPTPSPDDIYHWGTAVIGEPWGPTGYLDLIPWDSNGTITILLADLNQDYGASSYVVGYFWAKDNFTTSYVLESNQRIMFYIDATLYTTVLSAEAGTGWLATNYWPKVVYSTLAHEFQHMIQFYQKQVLRGTGEGAETWINEMCSMIMEDLVADKQAVEGPRGVSPSNDGSAGAPGMADGYRIPGFNSSTFSSLMPSNFDLTGYSTAYAFGAWLARNYGGAALLRRIVQSPQLDESAVVNAVIQATGNQHETFAGLLERWAAAVLLSSTTDAPLGYRYNTGDWFTSTIGGQGFNLGSINFFNYDPTPVVYTPTGIQQPSTTYHASNLYYQAAASLSGSKTWTVTIPDGVLMSVVIR